MLLCIKPRSIMYFMEDKTNTVDCSAQIRFWTKTSACAMTDRCHKMTYGSRNRLEIQKLCIDRVVQGPRARILDDLIVGSSGTYQHSNSRYGRNTDESL